MGLGLLLNLESRYAEAKPLLEDSVRGFRELGDEHWEMQVSRRLAWAYEELGDHRRAREIHEENLRRARQGGDAPIVARSLAVLAQYDLDDGRVEPAIPRLTEVYEILRGRRGITERYQLGILVCRLARALALKGETAASIRLLSCAEARFEELEIWEGNAEPWVVEMNDRTRELIGTTVDEETAAGGSEEGRKLTVDEAVTLALDLLNDSSGSPR